MEENEKTFKDKVVGFWDEHKIDIITLGVCYIGSYALGRKLGKWAYTKGYNRGMDDTLNFCEACVPEANVTSKMIQATIMSKSKK